MLVDSEADYPSGIRVNDEPVIYVFDNFLSAQECDHLIFCARNQMARAVVSSGSGGVQSEGRTNRVHWVPHKQTTITDKLSARVSKLVGIPRRNAESIQVIHYAQTQQYRPHYDAWDPATERGERCMARGGQRIVTCLFYLNDVAEGGGTIFPKLDLEVRAQKGRLVLFHNCKRGTNHVHSDTLHGGMPVISGEKWACNLWFRENVFQTPASSKKKKGATRRVV